MNSQRPDIWLCRVITLAALLAALGPARAQEPNRKPPSNRPEKEAPAGRPAPPQEAPEDARRKAEERILPPNRPADQREATGGSETKAGAGDYLIGSGDVLAINVWHEPEISRVLPVRPDGKISLPLAGELQASGLTPVQLQAKIGGALQAYLTNPEVAVIVQEIRSREFNILGEVQRPGSYPLTKRMAVLDAIAVAGGFREFANPRKIYVLRRLSNGNAERLPFDYTAFVKGASVHRNVWLLPGDTIVVP